MTENLSERDWTRLGWKEKTWRERANTALADTAAGIVVIAMAAVILWAIGTALEKQGQYREARESCLRQATNGLEIERCR